MKRITRIQLRRYLQCSRVFLFIILCIPIYSCNKYLDAKPDQSIATPTTIDDAEGILNNYNFINARYPSASEVSSDDFYLTKPDWSTLADAPRNYYTWQKYDMIGGDYSSPYSTIEYANIIIDALPKIVTTDVTRKNIVQGSALFVRAFNHYSLSQLFAKVYDKNTANVDLGIVLRLTSDIAVKPVRSTNTETYNSIIMDLKRAVTLLPANTVQKFKPSKAAVYGLLARVYLSMSDYPNAGLYADSALSFYNKLINYNNVSTTATVPFVQFNDEVIYDARTSTPAALSSSKAKIDTLLYGSYSTNDLRKTILFKTNANGSHAFKGNYTGQNNASLFTGIATNELYLIKAEADVRGGKSMGALQTINNLLVNRYKQGTYVPYDTSDPGQLLLFILQERRKDLPFRSLRWTDLRRFSKESNYKVILSRNLEGQTFQLPPGDPRYVFEIDRNAVNASGLVQNP
ncbi:RagB/SusD family nutrient uptake outer membrane protein [Mucilaginibacter sabulilitoris]|uniref:RagB/SusD family nutrient uptake outer membrane protein n=1 Tax=Mucilaginibacter sabulilitoris TaxID=1173583 RepID=A0ABZ0TUL1_9SPHI|nr:RagB/SusD family nutrient uptake outer membrane protein [Mucilaginibacter sabulilitoris]WPU94825.1 RagB/SusD family nutrient uptake outer membrane protein [Mucilaginibacter sabulilitoris]